MVEHLLAHIKPYVQWPTPKKKKEGKTGNSKHNQAVLLKTGLFKKKKPVGKTEYASNDTVSLKAKKKNLVK